MKIIGKNTGKLFIFLMIFFFAIIFDDLSQRSKREPLEKVKNFQNRKQYYETQFRRKGVHLRCQEENVRKNYNV